MITVTLMPSGETLRVNRNTITLTHKGSIYRRVGFTLVFELSA